MVLTLCAVSWLPYKKRKRAKPMGGHLSKIIWLSSTLAGGAQSVLGFSSLLFRWPKSVWNIQGNAMGYSRKSPTYTTSEEMIGESASDCQTVGRSKAKQRGVQQMA